MLGLAFLNGMVQFPGNRSGYFGHEVCRGRRNSGSDPEHQRRINCYSGLRPGRTAKPQHRIYIFAVGLLIFFMGTLANGILYSALGVILFILCKVIFQPFMIWHIIRS